MRNLHQIWAGLTGRLTGLRGLPGDRGDSRDRGGSRDPDDRSDWGDRGDRGDVPGWVMVTVMTAILVVAILGVFEPQIKSAISNAIDSVTSSSSAN